MKINITHQSNSISFEMEKNLPEHEAFGVLRAFSVSAFEGLPDPLVYSLADDEQAPLLQEPADWKEGMQKYFKEDEINLIIPEATMSDAESDSYCMITSNGDVEEEVEGVEASEPSNDEKMVIEDADAGEEQLEDKQTDEEVEEEPQEQPRSLKQRVLRFIAEVGGEGMQNLVAVAHSLISEGSTLANALRTAFETSEVASTHPFTADLLSVIEVYAERFQQWVPMIAQFNIDHIVALIPNIVDTITRSIEGQEHVELDLAPIFRMCNPAMMAHLQNLIPNGEERVFHANPANPFSVIDDAQEAVEEEFDNVVVHKGVVCDVCEMNPIRGIRYKSTLRPNYDLCENCEPAHDPNDPLIKFKKPISEIDTLPGVSEFSRAVGNRGRHFGRRGRGRGWRMFRGCGRRGRRGRMNEGGPKRGPMHFFQKMMSEGDCPLARMMQAENAECDRRDPTKQACNKEQMCKEMKEKFRQWKQKQKEWRQECNKGKKEWKCKGGAKKQWKKECKEAKKEFKKECKHAKKEWKIAKKEMKKCRKSEKKAAKKKLNLDAEVVDHLDMEEVSVQKPGATALKTWKVANTGTEAWPEGSCAVFVHGNKSLLVEGFEKCLVASVEPNSVAYVRVMFQAPELPGKYFVKYRMCHPNGKFGKKMVQTIIVEEPENDEESNHVEFNDDALEEVFERPKMSRATTTDTIMTAVTEVSECGDIPDVIVDDVDEVHPSAPRLSAEQPQREFPKEIALLKSMGFAQDDETLDASLVACKGDIAQAVSMLM